MIKKIISLLTVILFLSGCRPVNVDVNKLHELSILTLGNQLSLIGLAFDDDECFDVTVTNDMDDVHSALNDSSYDFVVAPIDYGFNNYHNNKNYKLFLIVQYNNYNVISKNENTNHGLLGCYSDIKGVNSFVEYLMDSGLRTYVINFSDSYDSLIYDFNENNYDAIVLDNYNYELLKANGEDDLHTIRNLDEDYNVHSDFENFPIYGLFVKTDVIQNNQDSLVSLAKTLKSKFSSYTTDSENLKNSVNVDIMGTYKINNLDVLIESLEDSNIDIQYAVNDMDNIKNYLDLCGISFDESAIIK